jgi:hypothetical protein
MDNESERASLMSSNLPTNRRGVDSLRSRGSRNWFDRLFKRENTGPAYQSVANEE